MKIKLKNFRCYIEKEFDFGEDGLLLLSGMSGSGKSSLLLAITFVLYGTGTKVVTFGKTSCSVEMEFDELKITRSKRPNRLVVLKTNTNEEFEDDSAQSIINERFGTAFEITCYLQQNAINSFILMSPLEKLEFLEKFAFQGVDLTAIKSRCTVVVKKRNEELIASTSQLEIASEHLKTLKKPKKILFPFKTTNQELKIKNETVKRKNTIVLIKRADTTIEKMKEEYNDLKIYLVKMEGKNSIISKSNEKIENINSELQHMEYEGDEALSQYEKRLVYILSQREIVVLQKNYDEDMKRLENMKRNELESISKEIHTIDEKLWKEYKSEEIATTILEYQQLLKDVETLEKLKRTIEKYKPKVGQETLEENIKLLKINKDKLSSLIIQKEIYECPSCHTSLKFQENSLIVVDVDHKHKNIEVEISLLENDISNLENNISDEKNRQKRYIELQKEIQSIESQYEESLPDKKEVESTIEYMQEYKRTHQDLEKRRKKLESGNQFSSSLQLLIKELEVKKIEIKKLEDKLKNRVEEGLDDEEKLREIIHIQKQNRGKIEYYNLQMTSLKKELCIAEQDIKELQEQYNKKYTEIKEIINIEKELQQKEEELRNLKIQLEECDLNMKKIEEYQKYKEELSRYTEWDTKVKELTTSEQFCKQQYSAATLLKEKILEAESLSILNIINSINIHAQEYLDTFFPDNPIVVRLLPFKTTKKNTSKPQINIEIDYKGMEADLTMLSGGELSRVVLAYTLALSEIFNGPILMLDECTSSLDGELTSTVMEGIKKHFGNKLVIIIAHQVVEGAFDRQISL
jgi:DNA repair exonuclease SbcCD ATPase subunit